MSGLAGQTSLFPPEPAPDPLLCWLWLAHVLGPAAFTRAGVLDAFGPDSNVKVTGDTIDGTDSAQYTVTIYGALREVTDPVIPTNPAPETPEDPNPTPPAPENARGLRSYSSGFHYADYPGCAECTAHHSHRGAGSR